jgi:hypothetical protein
MNLYVHYVNVKYFISDDSNVFNNIDAFQSTLYSCAEKEGIYLVLLCNVYIFIDIYIL